MSVSEKTVLITGANSGIGAGIAIHLAKIGYKRLALVARNAAKTEQVAEKCRAIGAIKVLVLGKDLSNACACQEAIEETVSHFGDLHVLIANAAITKLHSIREATLDDWNYMFNLNLTACFLLTKYALGNPEIS